MLFYTGIFAASLIAAFLARFLYRAITSKDTLVHISNKRLAITDGATRYQNERAGYNTCNDISVPSLQDARVVSTNMDKIQPAKLVDCRNQNSASLIHGSYEARRKLKPEPLTLEMVSKPFRRKVAPWAKNTMKSQSDSGKHNSPFRV